MITKKPKLLIRFIMLFTLTLSLVYASSVMSSNEGLQKISYKCMTTEQLQIEVEKRSIEGTLPFEMGLELMKRWQREESEVF